MDIFLRSIYHNSSDPFSQKCHQLFKLLRDSNAVVKIYKDSNRDVYGNVSFYAVQALVEQGETIDVEKLKREYFQESQWKELKETKYKHHVALTMLYLIRKGLMAVEDEEFQAMIPILMEKEFRSDKVIQAIVAEFSQE